MLTAVNAKFPLGFSATDIDDRWLPVSDFLMMENRFKMLQKSKPADAERLWKELQNDVNARWNSYEFLSRKDGK